MDSQTTDIPNFADIFCYDITTKALETLRSAINSYDVTIQKITNLLDVCSLLCKIKVSNSHFPIT